MTDSRAPTGALQIEFEPYGPSSEALDRAARSLIESEAFRAAADGGEYRLLSVEAVDSEGLDEKPDPPRPPGRFRATLYDYGRSRALRAEGDLSAPERAQLREVSEQPPVSSDEFAAAAEAVRRDSALAARFDSSDLAFYRPMPPLLNERGGPRRVLVGLFSPKRRKRLEIVGVDVASGILDHLEGGAPPGTRPGNDSICGAPVNASQPTSTKGMAGQVWVTVSQGGTTLWRFLAVRPAASSGLRGSGVELRYVDYRGRRVLYRGHVPILNVKYNGDACGPYRDWQWEEGQIQATGTDVAPGFRLCPSKVTTIMDTGSDTGNFLGVGIYVDGLEVVLVSEMEAGWYRYVSEWRLHVDGTIRPRFGFAATESPCVCNVHHHHAYWRLDFDILSAGNNRVREHNRVLCFRSWRELEREAARPRNVARRRKWRVEHVPSGAGYEIRPAAGDGIASAMPDAPYGRGDLWFLRYRGSELEDGMNSTSGPNTEADLAKFVNGETLSGQDVVVWYGAHFSHDIAHDDSALHGHILGPTLVPVNWPD
jgi:hypothetical protein